MPNERGTEYEQARFWHRDLQGWSQNEVQTDLELLRLRRRLIDHPWLQRREVE